MYELDDKIPILAIKKPKAPLKDQLKLLKPPDQRLNASRATCSQTCAVSNRHTKEEAKYIFSKYRSCDCLKGQEGDKT